MNLLAKHSKRWTRKYLALSPIFNNKVFSSGEVEQYLGLNPRLFVAYAINMLTLKKYTSEDIKDKIKQLYPQSTNKFIVYLEQITGITPPLALTSTEDIDHILVKRVHFTASITRVFAKSSNHQQFIDFVASFQQLSDLHEIHELDQLIIDRSLHTLFQIYTLCKLGEDYLHNCISIHTITFLESIIKEKINNIFMFTFVIDSLKHKIAPDSNLLKYLSIYKSTSKIIDQNYQFHEFQLTSYLNWLLNAFNLKDFLQKYLKQHFQFQEMLKVSGETILELSKILAFRSSSKLSVKIQNYELYLRLLNWVEQFSMPNIKAKLKIQKHLREIIIKSERQLDELAANNIDSQEAIHAIDQLYQMRYQLKSVKSINVVKRLFLQYYQHPYFNITTDPVIVSKMIEICQIIHLQHLMKSIQSKFFKNNQLPRQRQIQNDWLDILREIKSNSERKVRKSEWTAPTIESLNDLKLIKDLLQQIAENRITNSQLISSQQKDIILKLKSKLNSDFNNQPSEIEEWLLKIVHQIKY